MVHRRFRLLPPIRAAIAVFVALTCVAAVAAVGAIEQADPPVAAPGGWSKLGEPGFGAIVTSLSFSPTDSKKLLVGGEMNGVFYSSDNGVSVRPALGLRDYEVGEFTWHPTKPDEVWVGTMGGAYVSRDGGVTWSAARAGFPAPARWCYSAPVEKVLFDPTDATHLVAIGGSQRQWTNSCPEYRSAIWTR